MPEIWFPNLGIKINELNRVAFNIFNLPVYWYGIIIVSGFLIGILLAMKEAKRTGQNPDLYADFLVYALIFGLIGARVYYVIFSWDSYKNNLMDIFVTREGGLAIYGGIIAVTIVSLYYTKKKNIKLSIFLDTLAPSISVGQALGRWGNFFNREAFGGYTDNIFAMRYIKEQVNFVSKSVLDNSILINGVKYIQVHPTFLYESLWSICCFFILYIMQRKKKFDGQVFAMYLFIYSLGRLWIEGLRTDQLLLFGTGIAVSQLLAGLLIVGSGIFIAFKLKKGNSLEKVENEVVENEVVENEEVEN